jgi:predicted glutamine amidotransferase
VPTAGNELQHADRRDVQLRGFAQRGGRTDHHADGWGIAFFEGLRPAPLRRPPAGLRSPVAELIRRYPIKSRNVISHIRKATQGEVALENCHPFVRELWGRYWVFAHNGDLQDFPPRLHGSFRPVGTTDSERAFCWLMQEMSKSHAGVPSVQELTLTLRELSAQIASTARFNFLLSTARRCGRIAPPTSITWSANIPSPMRRWRRRPERELRRAHTADRQGRRGGDGAADHE